MNMSIEIKCLHTMGNRTLNRKEKTFSCLCDHNIENPILQFYKLIKRQFLAEGMHVLCLKLQ